MVHISPWSASAGLFAGAGQLLSEGALLVLYGPYREGDVPLASSNPEWGLREIAALDELARPSSLERTARHDMPANNFVLVCRRTKNARR